jgi:hypothetical protein
MPVLAEHYMYVDIPIEISNRLIHYCDVEVGMIKGFRVAASCMGRLIKSSQGTETQGNNRLR